MMKKIQLYNSISNSLEDFVPIDENNVRMYVCGPTVYASPHIGNARPMVVFDVLFRLLKRLYKTVTYVRNITDVDDKINTRAKEMGIAIGELTESVTVELHKNMALLNLLPVSHEPRATQHIPEMLDIVQRLMDNGFAYESHGHVLFRVRKAPRYGMLSKRSLDEMIAGSRVEVAPYKEDPMDFVLWKPAEEGMPSWESSYGAGRPGWHLECSAMSHKYLGEMFDIHAGGQDLMFPHHENELAQNFGAFGCLMANYWLHNGMLLVDGQKMSKSLGNIISLEEILLLHNGEIIRYVLLSSHYQKTLNWSSTAVSQAVQSVNHLYEALKRSDYRLDEVKDSFNQDCESPVLEALCKNLNTPLALQRLRQMADEILRSDDQNEINGLCRQLLKDAALVGLLGHDPKDWFSRSKNLAISESEIEDLMKIRDLAKIQRNFKLADEIRAQLLEKNIQVEDTKDGATWRILADPS
jgi:cysteinyl-tRNA synthetase